MPRRTRPSLPRHHALLLAAATAPVLLAAGHAAATIEVRSIRPGPGSSAAAAQSASESTAAPASAPIGAFPLTVPINGFQPLITFGLTNEHDNDFFTSAASGPAANATRIPTPAKYFIGTLDSGSNAHIMSYADEYAVDLLANAGYDGPNEQLIYGAGGPQNSEEAVISDGLGFYMAGLGQASAGPGGISVTGTMVGTTNTPILSMTGADSVVPNIIGTPMFAYNQIRILNSQTKRLTVNGQTYQVPHIQAVPQNTPLPAGYASVQLDLAGPPPFGAAAEVVFVFDPFEDDWSKNPTGPAVWNSMYADVDLSRNGLTTNDEQFLFDTGAQVTVLSSTTANKLGISTNPGNETPADFTVEVLGVGGIISEARGYFVDNLGLLTDFGTNTNWEDVPVIVIPNLPDPRDGSGSIPGILGMNIFNDRDLIVNSDFDQPTFAFTTATIPARWNVATGGDWGDNSKWQRGVPWQPGEQANFTSAISAPQTINVEADYTLGSMKFDNANRYTVSGPGTLRFEENIGHAAIQVSNGSHTVSTNVTLASDTDVTVIPAGSTLTMSGVISSPNFSGLVKMGQGTVEVKRLVDLGDVDVQAGKLKVLPPTVPGAHARTSSVETVAIGAAARLDLTNNNLIIHDMTPGSWTGSNYTGVQGLVRKGRNGGTWDGAGGLLTSTSAAASGLTGLGVASASKVLGIAADASAMWAGQTVYGASTLVLYTYAGDANLDGFISGDDYTAIDFSIAIPSASGWVNGDFNYDGIISGDDYSMIDFNIVAQGSAFPTAGGVEGVAAVPEPAACAIALLAAPLMLRRRRRAGDAGILQAT